MVLFSVKLLPQDCLHCQPGGVSLPHIISGDGLLSDYVGGCVWPEDCVNATEEVTEHLLSFRGATLAGGHEIIQVDVYLGQGMPVQLGGGLLPL